MKKEMKMEMPETITLPKDEELVRRLKLKLEEYRSRRNRCLAPELQHGTFCKIRVLSALLKDGAISLRELQAEMEDTFNDCFRELFRKSLYNAYMVVNCYVTGQTNRIACGTGLPE